MPPDCVIDNFDNLSPYKQLIRGTLKRERETVYHLGRLSDRESPLDKLTQCCDNYLVIIQRLEMQKQGRALRWRVFYNEPHNEESLIKQDISVSG